MVWHSQGIKRAALVADCKCVGVGCNRFDMKPKCRDHSVPRALEGASHQIFQIIILKDILFGLIPLG